MASFLSIYNRLVEEREMLSDAPTQNIGGDGDSPLLNSGEETKAMEVIRIGKNISKSIWEDFGKLCNNTDGLAELLGVRSEQVAGWAAKIQENLKKVDQADSQKKKNKMIATGGNDGPVQGDSDQGPVTSPSDTRPTP